MVDAITTLENELRVVKVSEYNERCAIDGCSRLSKDHVQIAFVEARKLSILKSSLLKMMLICASNSMLLVQRSVHRLVGLMFIDGRQDVNACIFKGGKKTKSLFRRRYTVGNF